MIPRSRLLLIALLALFVALVLIALLICPPAKAQEKPDSPEPKTHRVFWLAEGALAAAKTSDALSTVAAQNHGDHENNPILGKHPSQGKLAGYFAATFALDSTAFYFTEHNRRAWVRWVGRAYIAFVIEEHTRLAWCDARIPAHPSHTQNCRSFLPF